MQRQKRKYFYFQVHDYELKTTKRFPVTAVSLSEAQSVLTLKYFSDREPSTYDVLQGKAISKSYYNALLRQGGFPRQSQHSSPIYEVDIRNAMANTHSNRAAAKYLNVGWKKYRRWAKMYVDDGETLYEIQKKKPGSGLGKYSRQIPLNDILAGKHPQYSKRALRARLLSEGIKQSECEICGYDCRRPSDGKQPIIVHWENGDSTDHRIENISMMCLNCKFLYDEKASAKEIRKQMQKPKADDGIDWSNELPEDMYQQLRNL